MCVNRRKFMETVDDPVNCKLIRNLNDIDNNCRNNFSQQVFVKKMLFVFSFPD